MRNPLWLFRFLGLFLLRFAERQFWALLFQPPPCKGVPMVAVGGSLRNRGAPQPPQTGPEGADRLHKESLIEFNPSLLEQLLELLLE